MKKIIDTVTKEEIRFTGEDLPLFVHGKEHTGASLLSITLAANLHSLGNKLCIYTAHQMGKEEFLNQIENQEDAFQLEKEEDIEKALKSRSIIIQSGNEGLFRRMISDFSFEEERIIFLKNVETVSDPEIFGIMSRHPFMVSGDLEKNPTQKAFLSVEYATRIYLTNLSEEKPLGLPKYHALLKKKGRERVITII